MNKCPRCKKEVRDNEKYCHHCGYDMTQDKKRNQSKKMMLFFLVPFLVLSMPALMMKYFDKVAMELSQMGGNEVLLQDVEGYAPTYVIKTYTSLDDFDKQYSNVDSVVEGIRKFEESLTKEGVYDVQAKYKIELLDNHIINYNLYYDIVLNDRLTLCVTKRFDRLNLFNDEEYSFKTLSTLDFNELLLDEEEIDMISSFTKGKEVISRVVKDFSLRQDEFEYKKDHLGHYGIGSYEGSYSFVVNKQKDAYYSQLKYICEANELIK